MPTVPGTAGVLPSQRELELADGVVALVHGDGSAGVANCALLLGERTTVIDTMLLPEMAAGIVSALARRGRRADLVVNTHNHADHIGGNAVFEGVRTLAHPRTAAAARAMSRPGLPTLLGRVMPRFATRLAAWEPAVPDAAPPGELEAGLPDGAQLLSFTDAHSAADLAVWLPADGVLLAGDLCFAGVTPLAVHGRIGRWRRALDDLLALRPRVVLPGHGPPAGPQALRAMADYLDRILDAAARADAEGLTAGEALSGFDPGAAAGWLEPERTFVNLEVALAERNRTPTQGDHHVSGEAATHPRRGLLEG